jgi:hypothetical protein
MIIKKSIPLLLGILLIACNEKKNSELIQSYIDMHNTHDVEKSLGYYHEDAVFELKGVWTKKGLDDIRGLEEFDAAMNSHLDLREMRQSGDTVYSRVVENNDWFGAIGITDLIHDPVVFVIEGRKIKNIIGYPDQETGKEIEAAIGQIFEWSQKTGDSAVFELLPKGEFMYSTAAAAQWKALFERMKESDSIP